MNNLMPPPKNKVGIDPMIAQTKIPWDEIAKHNTTDDCWIVINNIVLDVTDYLNQHPGKPQPVMVRAGKGNIIFYKIICFILIKRKILIYYVIFYYFIFFLLIDATASFQAMYHSQKATVKTFELAIGVVDPSSQP